MFFKQIWRNASKNRKDSGLFFASLIIAIVEFYTLLSLGEQDVIRFLSEIESDAVKKLLALLPLVYIVSLFFVFFLVYFACKYQADNRRREFGVYLMLGMKRTRLFFMLLFETLSNSLIAIIIGMPISLFLTEGISLASAKIVGLGIVGHKFSFSPEATLWTVCGFIIVQLVSMLVISVPICKTEPAELLHSDVSKKQTAISSSKSAVFFISGIVMLCTSYYLGIFRLRSLSGIILFFILLLGISGTFFLYRGLGAFLGNRIQKKFSKAKGSFVFTARQLQENVLSQHKSLSIASLLIMLALSCTAYGISLGAGRSTSTRSVDFSVSENYTALEEFLKSNDAADMIKTSYPMYLSIIKEKYFHGEENEFDMSEMKSSLEAMKDTENIIENLHIEYVISESSYNNMLVSTGKEKINLEENKVAFFTSMSDAAGFCSNIKKAAEKNISIGIDGKKYSILPEIYTDNIVADRAISLYLAIIVPDEIYCSVARETQPYCQNILLSDKTVKENGLMQSIQSVEKIFDSLGIEYDSYLKGIGRNLFYTVSASYLTIYLGVLFLLISNTVIGLKYLIQQRQTKRRYITLSMLGGDMNLIRRSVKKQISAFFLLTILPAVISGTIAVISMFMNMTKLPVNTSHSAIITLSVISAAIFLILEIIYTSIVKKIGEKEILTLKITDRR